MRLRAPREQRRDHRDADTAARIAHQVEDAGSVPHLLVTQGAERDGRERHKNKSHREAADDIRPNDATDRNLEIDLAELIDRIR